VAEQAAADCQGGGIVFSCQFSVFSFQAGAANVWEWGGGDEWIERCLRALW